MTCDVFCTTDQGDLYLKLAELVLFVKKKFCDKEPEGTAKQPSSERHRCKKPHQNWQNIENMRQAAYIIFFLLLCRKIPGFTVMLVDSIFIRRVSE